MGYYSTAYTNVSYTVNSEVKLQTCLPGRTQEGPIHTYLPCSVAFS